MALPERCRYLGVRVTAKEVNNAQMYGPQAVLFFSFWQHSMRSEVDWVELALGGLPWRRASRPSGPEALRHERAQGLHAPENRSHHL